MDITPLIPKNRNVINGYGVDGFKINDTIYKNTVILTASQLLEVKADSVTEIFSSDLKNIFNEVPEILLIGTGTNHVIISPEIKNKIKSQFPSITISEMATGAACRTYNILMTEDRGVAVVLYFEF